MLEVKVKKFLPDFQLDIDLALDGEILSVLGPSGSGKTLTLLCAAGLMRPDQGSIRLNNRILYSSDEGIHLPPQKRKIGFVFQNYALFPHLTAYENIAYGIIDNPKPVVKQKVTELLELIHIPELKDRYPGELSSGQQQRVALARALAPEPEALLLDEPFSALDTFRRERLEYELLALHQYYRGDILFVTHDLNQGFKLGDRIAIFENGQLAQCDSRNNVISSPANLTAAKMTGVKNLFRGKISIINEGSIEACIPEFERPLKVITGTKPLNLAINQYVYIGIRPEHLEIKDEPQENAIMCRVEQLLDGITTLHCFYHAESDRREMYKIESCMPRPLPPPRLKLGISCYLYFPPERMIILSE